MTVDLLFVAHNRLAFTETTFPALVQNTNWERVAHLHVLDDLSADGTAGYLAAEVSGFYNETGMRIDYASQKLGGPVAAMNHALDNGNGNVLVKIDNDVLLCPGWLDALLDVLDAAPELDVLGFEAGFGDGLAPAGAPRTWRESSHCGGVGAFRCRLFDKRRPKGHGSGGRFGWTQFQRDHARCAWLVPDMACVAIDRLPFEPWASLSAHYVALGWQRPWPPYPSSMAPYWADLALA